MPVFRLKIPFDRIPQGFIERYFGLPSHFLEFLAGECVPAIMTGPNGMEIDEFGDELFPDDLGNLLRDLEIREFVESDNVVTFAGLSVLEEEIHRGRRVPAANPVAAADRFQLPFLIQLREDRHRRSVQDRTDGLREKFFGMLPSRKVVHRMRRDDRKPVRDEKSIAECFLPAFRGRAGIAWPMRLIFFVRMAFVCGAEHFVCRKVDELFEIAACACVILNVNRTNDIVHRKQDRILDRAVYVRGGGEVEYVVGVPETFREGIVHRRFEVMPLEADMILVLFIRRYVADTVEVP